MLGTATLYRLCIVGRVNIEQLTFSCCAPILHVMSSCLIVQRSEVRGRCVLSFAAGGTTDVN